MKDRKRVTIFDIPLGMCLSVENNQTFFPVHPVRDASLTGCCFRVFFTFLPRDASLTGCDLKIRVFWKKMQTIFLQFCACNYTDTVRIIAIC